MKVEKYPSVIFCIPYSFRIIATKRGPKAERWDGEDEMGVERWEAADLGKDGGDLLFAYHQLMQGQA